MLNNTEFKVLSDQGKSTFGRIQNAARRMQMLIDDLLSYSRTNTGHHRFEKIQLDKIINEVKEDLREEIFQKKAIIEVSNSCELNIIEFQFRQLFHNLVSNSLKFSDSRALPYIQVNSETVDGRKFSDDPDIAEKKYCHLSVADNGIGFEPQYKEKIFELFQRLHGRQEYNGTGIGLAIVKRIVENHNGFITATGEPDKGARFDIFIPVS
jgi:signal transduction histidine kinase